MNKEHCNHVYQTIAANKLRFFVTFFLVTVLTYGVLYALDFYPEPRQHDESAVENMLAADADGATTVAVNTTASADTPLIDATTENHDEAAAALPRPQMLPTRIVIPQSETDVTIQNPASLDMDDLDAALLDGVVRHPQSAHFGDPGNILIFGHSSYLPNVLNSNFQAFNGIQDLKWGDEITVYGTDGTTYQYRVDSVYRVKASETIVDNSRGVAKLTLVTCNSFGSKDDRYIVEANLISAS